MYLLTRHNLQSNLLNKHTTEWWNISPIPLTLLCVTFEYILIWRKFTWPQFSFQRWDWWSYKSIFYTFQEMDSLRLLENSPTTVHWCWRGLLWTLLKLDKFFFYFFVPFSRISKISEWPSYFSILLLPLVINFVSLFCSPWNDFWVF